MKRRGLLALAGAASLLAGCGFQLRQPPVFAFSSIAINAPARSPLAADLRTGIAQDSRLTVLPAGADPARAQVIFDLTQEQREKVVVAINASGEVREFELRLRIHFRVRTPQGKEVIPDTELVQMRDISFTESAVLAKEAEEALLYRDMQADLVQQLMRRLGAIKTL